MYTARTNLGATRILEALKTKLATLPSLEGSILTVEVYPNINTIPAIYGLVLHSGPI